MALGGSPNVEASLIKQRLIGIRVIIYKSLSKNNRVAAPGRDSTMLLGFQFDLGLD